MHCMQTHASSVRARTSTCRAALAVAGRPAAWALQGQGPTCINGAKAEPHAGHVLEIEVRDRLLYHIRCTIIKLAFRKVTVPLRSASATARGVSTLFCFSIQNFLDFPFLFAEQKAS